jgi:hypothetical protein
VQPSPAPLPRSLADPRPLVALGTVAWFATAVVLLVVDRSTEWVWTCLVGGLLGLIGLTMIYLQRTAAQRGSRGAQQGLL